MMINLKKVWNDNPFDQWTEEELLCMEEQGICYGKGGGSAPPPPAVQTTTQTSEFPTELRPFISDIFEKGQAVQEQRQEEGFQPELTQQLAPFTPDQQAAFEGIRQQVGQTRPLFDEATTLARDATRGATDPTEIAGLMNPFLRNVVDIEKREAERVADVQEQQLGARAAQAGAFGGSRAAILEAERQRNLNQQLGDIESRGLATAFQDAQNRLQSQFGREAAGATQLSALGTAIPAQVFKELGALSGVGAAEQQQGQRALDIATQQAREEFGFPQQTLQDFSSILRGFPLPPTTNVSRQTFSPAQPLSTQLLGLGTGLAGLAGAAGAFKKAGGRVGAPTPVALKNGGYVKLAGGGGLGEMMQGEVQRYQEGGRTQVETLSRLSIEELKDLLNNPAKAAKLGLSSVLVQRALGAKENELLALEQDLRIRDDKTARPADLQLSAIAEAGVDDVSVIEKMQANYPYTGSVSKDPFKGFTGTIPKPDLGTPTSMEEAREKFSMSVSKDPFKGFTGTIPKPDLGTPTSMAEAQQKFPFKIPPRVDRTSDAQRELDAGMPPMQLGFGKLLAPDAMGIRDRKILEETEGGVGAEFARVGGKDRTAPPPAAPELISAELTEATGLPVDAGGGQKLSDFQLAGMVQGKELPDQRRYASSSSPSALPSSFSNIPVPTTGYGSLEDMRKAATFQPSLLSGDPITRADQVASGYRKAAGLDPDSVGAGIVEREEDFLTAKFTGTGSPPQDVIAIQLEEAMKSVNPEGPFIDEEAVTKAVDVKEGPDGGVAAKKGPDGLTGEIVDADISLTKVSESDPAARPQDAAGKVETQARRELGEYYKDAEKILGKPPEFEKGEESDFTSRKWLALAQFGTNMLRAGGDKTVFQAMGEAAQPALKELISISKEEKKLKGELRKERNAQKQRNYSDRLAKLGIAQRLERADLDHTKAMADIADKRKKREIDQKTYEINKDKADALINKNQLDMRIAHAAFYNTQKGLATAKDIRKEISDYRKAVTKAAMKNLLPGQSLDQKALTATLDDGARRIYKAYDGKLRVGNEVITNVAEWFGKPAEPAQGNEFKSDGLGGQFRRKK